MSELGGSTCEGVLARHFVEERAQGDPLVTHDPARAMDVSGERDDTRVVGIERAQQAGRNGAVDVGVPVVGDRGGEGAVEMRRYQSKHEEDAEAVDEEDGFAAGQDEEDDYADDDYEAEIIESPMPRSKAGRGRP